MGNTTVSGIVFNSGASAYSISSTPPFGIGSTGCWSHNHRL
jgi:hypothetical protein